MTHHLSDVIPEIDRVVLMRNGKVQADGQKADLLEPRKISDLFGIQVEITRRDRILPFVVICNSRSSNRIGNRVIGRGRFGAILRNHRCSRAFGFHAAAYDHYSGAHHFSRIP